MKMFYHSEISDHPLKINEQKNLFLIFTGQVTMFEHFHESKEKKRKNDTLKNKYSLINTWGIPEKKCVGDSWTGILGVFSTSTFDESIRN